MENNYNVAVEFFFLTLITSCPELRSVFHSRDTSSQALNLFIFTLFQQRRGGSSPRYFTNIEAVLLYISYASEWFFSALFAKHRKRSSLYFTIIGTVLLYTISSAQKRFFTEFYNHQNGSPLHCFASVDTVLFSSTLFRKH